MFNAIVNRYEAQAHNIFPWETDLCVCANCKHRYPDTMTTWQQPHSMVKGDVYVCSQECGMEWLETNWEAVEEYEAILNG